MKNWKNWQKETFIMIVGSIIAIILLVITYNATHSEEPEYKQISCPEHPNIGICINKDKSGHWVHEEDYVSTIQVDLEHDVNEGKGIPMYAGYNDKGEYVTATKEYWEQVIWLSKPASYFGHIWVYDD